MKINFLLIILRVMIKGALINSAKIFNWFWNTDNAIFGADTSNTE